MIFGKTKLELKLGVFVFVGMVILVLFILLIGDFQTWTSGYEVNFLFNFVNGVKIGAPVRFSGVDVGEVKAIKFLLNPPELKPKVQIVGWVKKEIKIPLDSTVWVNTLGLLGEKYIEVMPGEDFQNHLAKGESLVGHDPIAMHEVAQLAKNIAGDLDESLVKIKNGEGTIGKLLYDDTIYNELEALVKDVRRHPWKLFFKTKEKPEKK
ncbi:MAG: MCE family protein [Candidatus Omnitrophica bacterium]|nr:MCE family protein [Candidatus Omnitrophota bacterium]